jgi:hypothetical protein
MELLNLTLAQFLTVFGAVSFFSVALYLLDRARRRQVVPTLRFWVTPGQPAPVTRRRRIQQPLSLLLQLLGMALLLLAVADLQWGTFSGNRRNHALILDTSAWMGASLPGHPGMTLMDQARADGLAWLRAVPADDRVLVIRADGLATPATGWETDHRAIAKAILESEPGATALEISQAIRFAQQSQRQAAGRPGEIVYAGPGRIAAHGAPNETPAVASLRILNVADPDENCGLRSVGARLSQAQPGVWDVLVRARNYGSKPKTVQVTLNFGKAPVGARPLELAPGEEKEAVMNLRSRAAGILEARLYPRDSFAADNYAALELPEMRTLRVVAYTSDPGALRAALESDPRISAEFRSPSEYRPPNGALVILHRFRPATPPAGNAIWIDPPAGQSPVPVREKVKHPANLRWAADQPLAAGLRSRDIQIEEASVFAPAPGLINVAEADSGPVMVARGQTRATRTVVMGFDPFSGPMRYELATPLLLGNALRWISPEYFRDTDVTTQSAGAISAPLSGGADRNDVEVLTDSGARLPFNAHARSVDFFAGESARVRVLSGSAERVYSLTLPEMWDARWTPPAGARHGIPRWTDRIRHAPRLWPFLAIAGALLLIAEWAIYGRESSARLRIVHSSMERAA